VSFIYSGVPNADGKSLSNDNDNPAMPVDERYKEYNVKQEGYHDYIMYLPPGKASIVVPLADFKWSWNVDVIIPTVPTNNPTQSWFYWNNASTKGTVTGAATASRQLKYPIWPSLRDFTWLSP
jgi:hypothetical protein